MPETLAPQAPSAKTSTDVAFDVADYKRSAPKLPTTAGTASQTAGSVDTATTPFHSATTKPLDALVFIGMVLLVFVMMIVVMVAF